MHFASLALACTALTAVTAAVLPVSKQGKYLYTSDGNRFFIKGVAYQRAQAAAVATVQSAANGGFPEPSSYLDPLVDITAVTRDIPNFTALGVNTIRVYNINPYGDHSAAMAALSKAGIYVIADVGLPLNGSINRAVPSWDVALMDAFLTTVNNLLPYDNLLAVNVGNEVVTSTANSNAGPFIKAAVRDVKAFIASKGKKTLVGYSSVDGAGWRTPLANYLTCGSAATSIDLYGLNSYAWCGDQTYASSGDSTVTTAFANFPVPAIFSEFGCVSAARTWTEVAALFSAPMTDVWSGGIAFEYFADALGYGLTDNTTSNDGAITTNAQFALLAAQYKAAAPPASTNATVAASVYPTCAANANLLASAVLPPTPSYTECSCLVANAFGCVTNTAATPLIVGALLDYSCSLLGSVGGSCTPIGADGTTGVYGPISSCSAPDKLSYVASQYYAQQAFNAQACSFGGNLTVNTLAPKTAAGLTSSIASCVAAGPTGVFVPMLPVGVIVAAGGASSGSSNASAASSASGSSPTASGATPAASTTKSSASKKDVIAGVFVASLALGSFALVF